MSSVVAVQRLLDSGSSLLEVATQHFGVYLRHRNNILNYMCLTAPRRTGVTECVAIVGYTEIGKSHWAFTRFPDAYWKPGGNWWPIYMNEEVVVLDEFHGNQISFSSLKRVLDRYPLIVEVKGTHVQFNSKLVIITANEPIEKWYPNLAEELMDALRRRITLYHVSSVMEKHGFDLDGMDELYCEAIDFQMP